MCSVNQNPLFVKFIESVHVILLDMADVCYYPVFKSVTTVKQLEFRNFEDCAIGACWLKYSALECDG